MILKELLIQYELQNNLSHAEMADMLNVSLSTYYRWLSGESTRLKKTTIQKLSDVLECDVEEVIEETHRLKPILGNVKAGYDLYFYKNEKGTLEMDFFIRDKDSLIPVEVKANDNATVSLNNLIDGDNYKDIKYGIKLCNKNIGFNGKFYTFPYFMAFLLKRYLKNK